MPRAFEEIAGKLAEIDERRRVAEKAAAQATVNHGRARDGHCQAVEREIHKPEREKRQELLVREAAIREHPVYQKQQAKIQLLVLQGQKEMQERLKEKHCTEKGGLLEVQLSKRLEDLWVEIEVCKDIMRNNPEIGKHYRAMERLDSEIKELNGKKYAELTAKHETECRKLEAEQEIKHQAHAKENKDWNLMHGVIRAHSVLKPEHLASLEAHVRAVCSKEVALWLQ